jgi:hypothetical protein
MLFSIQKLILNSKISKTSILLAIISSFFILSDFLLSYEDLKSTNKHLTRISLSLEKPLRSKNKTENYQNLTNEAAKNNFKLIKKLLCPPFGIYVHEPIADFLLENVFLPKSANIISNKTKANLITITCICISFPIFLFICLDSNKHYYRKLACVLFQIRNILDFLDGKLARSDKNATNQQRFDSGRIYDALGSSCPTLLFLLGSYIFILNDLDIFNSVHESNETNKLNFYYKTIHKLFKWVRNKVGIGEKNAQPIFLRLDLVKEVYCSLTIFTIYIIIAGVVWNQVLDSNKQAYANHQAVSDMIFFILI